MISQNRYIKVVSGVGAGVQVAERKLVMRVVTQNPIIPPGVVIEFQTADAVGSYFGMNSQEYKRAAAYFKFISKSVTSPPMISFARWASEDIAPMIIGDALPKNLAALKAVSAGTLSISVAGTVIELTAIDLRAATDLTNVASLLQTAIRTSVNVQLVNANVTYNTNTNQFTLTGSVAGSGALSVFATGTPADISQLTGWATGGTVLVAGQAKDEPAQAIAKSTSVSNNLGSFVFATPAVPLTVDQIKAVSEWNAAQNNMYVYSVAVVPSSLAALFELVKGNSGTALNVLSATATNDFVEQSNCEILAAINYNLPNATQNYMYYQFQGRNITASDDPTASTYDKSRGNYIGVTQVAGQQLAFYQRGILCGGPNDATDMNAYGNEMWLKSAIISRLMSLFLAMPDVPANPVGASMCLAVLQPVLTGAGDNGVFSPGKTLDAIQQQYITQISGDANAWRQVFTLGYWINIRFSSYVNADTNLVEWKASYQLIYSKGDSIRFVDGSDIMI